MMRRWLRLCGAHVLKYAALLDPPTGFVRRKDPRILADEDARRSTRLTFAASPRLTANDLALRGVQRMFVREIDQIVGPFYGWRTLP